MVANESKQAWHGMARRRGVKRGEAGQSRHSGAMTGTARHSAGWRGRARQA